MRPGMVVGVMMVVAMVGRRCHGCAGKHHHRDRHCDKLTHNSVLILSVVASRR
jgi:hypothetical protein